MDNTAQTPFEYCTCELSRAFTGQFEWMSADGPQDESMANRVI